jgi:hypothetical protein
MGDPISVRGLADNMAAMKEMNLIGATAAQVRATVTWLRDVHDNFDKAWQALNLPDHPEITAAFHTLPLEPTVTVIYFGAEEPPGYGNTGPTVVVNEKGEECADEIGVDFIMFGENVLDLTMGPNPYEMRALSVADFFSSPVYLDRGLRVSRFDVVEYAAYQLGAVHSNAGRYQNKNPSKMASLDRLKALQPFHRRDNVEYLLLSVARDLCQSADVNRFISAAKA